jgi:hypothetical protein
MLRFATLAMADDLEERLQLAVLPALARARDDLAAATRRRSQWDEERRLEGERLRLVDEVGSLQGELVATRDYAMHMAGLHDRAVQEIDAIKASWSWRLTEPLRFLGTLVQYAGRRRS